MGHHGHGVRMSACMVGQQMAEVLAGRPEAKVRNGLDRPAIPGHFAPRWGLPPAGTCYRRQDIVR